MYQSTSALSVTFMSKGAYYPKAETVIVRSDSALSCGAERRFVGCAIHIRGKEMEYC